MQYRTDLAVEVDALLAEAQQRAQGYIKKQCQIDEDIAVTDITITTEDSMERVLLPVWEHFWARSAISSSIRGFLQTSG